MHFYTSVLMTISCIFEHEAFLLIGIYLTFLNFVKLVDAGCCLFSFRFILAFMKGALYVEYLIGGNLQVGFDALFFGRADYQDIANQREHRTMEMVWHSSKSFGTSAEVGPNL